MSDAPAEEIDAPTINSMAAFSNQLQELTDSLNLLYIRDNASGRNKFRHKWPDVALFIFGEQLIVFDNDGVTNSEDRERRRELEAEAGERRVQIKQTISEIVDKSVDQGSLLFDYVGGVIDIYGTGISRFLYAEDVIERVRPGLIASSVTVQEADDAQKEADSAARDELISKNAAALNDSAANHGHKMPLEDQKLSVEEQSILSNTSAGSEEKMPSDTLDDIKPIETEAPVRTLNNPVPEAPQEVVEEKVTAEVEQPAEEQPKEDVPAVPVVETVETAPPQDKPEEKPEGKQEAEKAVPLSPPSMSEALDSIKPIDTGSVPDEAPQKQKKTPPESPKEAVEEKVAAEVVKEDTPKETPAEEKKSIEDSSSAPVKEEPVVEAPAIEKSDAEVPKTETVEDKSTSEKPANSVEKGTYVALFNGLAQVV